LSQTSTTIVKLPDQLQIRNHEGNFSVFGVWTGPADGLDL